MSTVTGWRKRTIMELAREAGAIEMRDNDSMGWGCEFELYQLEAFAELVRADERNRTWTQDHWTEYERNIAAVEREACAKVCETHGVHPALNVWNGGPDWYKHGKDCAETIRARGQT